MVPPLSLGGLQAVVFGAVGTLLHTDPPAAVVYCQIGRDFGSQISQEMIESRFRQAFLDEELKDQKGGWRTSESREIERWKHIIGRVLDDVRDPEICFRELF